MDITNQPGYDKSICPRCNTYPVGFPALSRADNKTHICSACGADEGLIQFFDRKTTDQLAQPGEWPVQLKYVVGNDAVEVNGV